MPYSHVSVLSFLHGGAMSDALDDVAELLDLGCTLEDEIRELLDLGCELEYVCAELLLDFSVFELLLALFALGTSNHSFPSHSKLWAISLT